MSPKNKRPTKKSDPDKSEISRFEKKQIRWGLRQFKIAGSEGILIEGIKLIEEAVAAGHPLEAVWVTEAFASANHELVAHLEESAQVLRRVSPRTFRELTALETPPGIVAVAEQPNFIFRNAADPYSLIVVLPLIQDPGNLGGIIRTADYFGVDELWLGPNSADPYRPKVLRGSMGATFRLPVIRTDNLLERLRSFKANGAEIWAAAAHGDGSCVKIAGSGSRILILGSEAHGLEAEVTELADKLITIPGAKRGESLNLSIAAGILIHQATSGRWEG
ncbi:MAG: RNA methyltransferase [Calditrichaeota bacterium]|nr:RNA methyltransferase [Calditrichota bacterium]MBT7616473.1 RNA methyltransferase [Calditrichota bacterium]